MSDNLRGSLAMIISMAAFAVEDALLKFAMQTVPTSIVLMLFGVVGLCLFAGLSVRAKEPVLHTAILSPPMLVRSVFELGGRLFFFLALAFSPLSSTTAILQSAPLVVTLGAVLFLGAHVGPRRWVAMGVGFIGVLLILRPTPASFEMASIFAVLATIGFSGRDLATSISPKTMSGNQLGTLGFIVLILAGFVLLPFQGLPSAPMEPLHLAIVAGTTIVGVVAYNTLTLAMRTGDISVVTPFRYSRMLFALVFAVFWFGERPDFLMLAGTILIVGSGLYTLIRSGGKIPSGTKA
ncbi:DMT family transporter [Shimia thalassica]|uniref:DMT family transporter n=1 Tax=Shimia thalassica TaxID=1715693 RepID=UPI001C0A43C6|nr:DMT family transporter [Shimia thalassica]MBU2941290.1 DMT family transporter [Shimia thalassica]MDO6503225.1 DMT family transporter [Shimia thalassica]MDO6522708.1 DMT family transporter [Shimia thalassica]MDP2518382.1 DMT family transporter [Shimia thalassica]MDP2579768.1 DMT family transporter [Shimia thalassica]